MKIKCKNILFWLTLYSRKAVRKIKNWYQIVGIGHSVYEKLKCFLKAMRISINKLASKFVLRRSDLHVTLKVLNIISINSRLHGILRNRCDCQQAGDECSVCWFKMWLVQTRYFQLLIVEVFLPWKTLVSHKIVTFKNLCN